MNLVTKPESRGARWGLDERLPLWLLLVAFGYAWVSLVQCGRPAPFVGRDGGYTHFLRLMALAPLLYALGPCCVLRNWREAGPASLAWNGLGYALPFFVGLQFFYLQRIDAINFSLTYADFQRMGPVAMFVFAAVGLLIAALAAWHLRQARRQGILPAYASAFTGAIALLALITYALRESHYLHVHHWFFFCFFVPFARFPQPLSMACQAMCAGIAVEGVAEWSLSTIWELR